MGMQLNLATAEDIEHLNRRLDEVLAKLDRVTVTPAPEWISLAAAADHYGVTVRTIRSRIDRGETEARGSGRGRQVRIGKE